jgi:hypothetical protein
MINRIGLLITIVLLFYCEQNPEYRKISADEYMNKMKAAWIGQMIGVG